MVALFIIIVIVAYGLTKKPVNPDDVWDDMER